MIDKYLNIKKLRDPKFYLENFTKIKGKVPGKLIPFILNEAQKDLLNTVNKYPRVIICKSRQIGFCLDPKTKVLTANLEWITLDEIKVGQSIIAIDENISGGKGSARKIKTAIVENKFDVYSDAVKLTMDNGYKLIATSSHRFLFKDSHFSRMVWKRVDEIKIGDETGLLTSPWGDKTYEDGWIGGMIDGEGSLAKSSRTGVSLTISQVDGPVWDRLERYAVSNNINYRIEVDRRKPENSGKFGSKEVNKLVVSNMFDVLRIIGKTAPSRLLGKYFWEGKRLGFVVRPKIVKIEYLPKQRMVDLQTSAKTYIAEGIVSHNSTAMTGYFYHNTILNPGTTTALIGYNSELTAELLDKVKTFYRSTPADLKPTIHYNSKYEISFPRVDSKILVLPSTENVGRGYTLSNCLCTELSSWEKQEEKMTTLEASVPINGRLVIESTPKGQANLYHRMWMAEDNGYIKKEYGWHWGYTREQIELIKKRMNNPMKFAQEYGLEFLASGRSVFDQNIIKKQRKNILNVEDAVTDNETGEIYFVKEEDGLRIYKRPSNNGIYCMGVDSSEGVEGGDYSVAIIWDRKTGEEVAMFRGLLAPDILAKKLDKWGRIYNNALMVVEINNHGLTVVTVLRQLVYPTLYFRQAKFETIGQGSSDKIGWKTTKMTRPLLIDDFAQATRDNLLIIHSKELLNEMSVFVYNDNGDMQPMEGFHDDCLFAAGIGFQGFKIITSAPQTQIDYKSHLPVNFVY